ncbi:hypothetical protein ACFX13_030613 [Malus domestica]
MRSARSTQQKESELRNSRSCHICLKKQAEKNAACTVNSAERALWAARADSPPLNQILKDQVTNWNKSPSTFTSCLLAMCSSQPSRIKPQRPLKKLPAEFKIKPRRPWKKSQESRKSFNPVQDQSCGKSTSATKYVPIHPLPKPKIIYHMKLLVVQFQPSRSSLDGP